MNIPIVTLKVEGMRHEIHTALTKHQAAVDEALQEAIADVCSPANIERTVKEAAA